MSGHHGAILGNAALSNSECMKLALKAITCSYPKPAITETDTCWQLIQIKAGFGCSAEIGDRTVRDRV